MRLSWQARIICAGLRHIEKPRLRRARDPVRLRRRFETSAKWLFHPPRDVGIRPIDIAGAAGLELIPPALTTDRYILYWHGGGYLFGSPATHAPMLARLSKLTGMRVLLPSYPLAPEHPFPAATETAWRVWCAMDDRDKCILGGDSAGGGLAFSLLAQILTAREPGPAGVFAFSPLTDLTFGGSSIATNAQSETILPASRIAEFVEFYMGAQNPADPRASPLFADFATAPRTWLCADTTELLYDDTTRLVGKLRAENVDVTTQFKSGLPHVWPMFHNTMPEARDTLKTLAGWIRQGS